MVQPRVEPVHPETAIGDSGHPVQHHHERAGKPRTLPEVGILVHQHSVDDLLRWVPPQQLLSVQPASLLLLRPVLLDGLPHGNLPIRYPHTDPHR